ncbi:MAG: arsenate reductase ArsC [Desulfovibrionales bacterium]
MEKHPVLFICVHNSGRSQMAEAFLNHKAGDRYPAESAGQDPTAINPLVVAVMKEKGIDLSGKETQSVFKLYQEGRLYHYVITVCQESIEEKCPVFPGIVHREKWGFEDPEAATGSEREKLAYVRRIRDAIETRIDEWIGDHS